MALDPAYFFYSDGTISLENGSDIAIGDMVFWDTAVLPFDTLYANDGQNGVTVIKEVLSVNQLRLAKPWAGPTLTNVPYFVLRWIRHTDPRVYAVRVSEYLTRLKGIPENIEQVAGEIHADRQAVDAAMVTLQQIEVSVNADREAAETAAGSAQGAAAAAAGSADEARQWAETASSGVLPDKSVTNPKLADMPANTIKGTDTTGRPKDLTVAQVQTMLDLPDALGKRWTKTELPAGATGKSILAAETALAARQVLGGGVDFRRVYKVGVFISTTLYSRSVITDVPMSDVFAITPATPTSRLVIMGGGVNARVLTDGSTDDVRANVKLSYYDGSAYVPGQGAILSGEVNKSPVPGATWSAYFPTALHPVELTPTQRNPINGNWNVRLYGSPDYAGLTLEVINMRLSYIEYEP